MVAESVPVRDAATVMLLRDAIDESGASSVEVCMLRRNLASEFVAGAYVFPGGSVDPEDGGPQADAICRGLDDRQASDILGIEAGGLAFWVAALRECFEEAGVLVAYPRSASPDRKPGSSLLDTSDVVTRARFAKHRQGVNAGTTRFTDVCRNEDLVLAGDTVHYVSRWITPELAPRRYDTRFFVTAAPAGQTAQHDNTETIATIWVRPADALDRFAAGEIELLPPTIANLRNLAPFSNTTDALEWAAAVTDIVTILPIVLVEDGQILVLRPGDDGYAEALALQAASGGASDELIETARAAWGTKRSGQGA